MTTAEDKNSSVSCEAQLDGLHLLTNAGIFSTDVNLNVTSWNYWLEAHSGKSSQIVLGRNLLDIFPEIAQRELNAFYEQALRGQVVVLSQPLHQYLIRLPASDGSQLASPMPQSAKIAPLVDDGAIVGTLTLIEDVTERIAREAELFVRVRQQAAIATLSREALASHNLDRLFQQAVSIIAEGLEVKHCAIFCIESETVRLKAGLGWNAPENTVVENCGDRSHISSVLRIAKPVIIADFAAESCFEVPRLLRDAGIVSGIVVPISCHGDTCAVLGVYTTQAWIRSAESLDFLTTAANTLGTAIEREALERDLRDRAQELTTADRRKDEFLAMLAHELRNPLASIRNAVQLMYAKDAEDEDTRAAHNVVERQVRQMTRLVDELLDVSRITRGKIELRTETVNLTSAVEQALENSQPQIDAHRHELTVSIPPYALPVRADVTRLAQALSNLINNAAKYTDPGGKILVSVQQEGSDYVVRVRDNGIGISSDMLPHIFDLFTQVDNSLARSEGGLGIGLTLVRTLIEMHGGTVQAFSDGKDKGSEFVVRLPALSEHVEPHGESQQPALRKGMTPARRILIVDDNRDAADMLTRLLKAREGHVAHGVHSGPAALEEIGTFHPDLVFLDIGLPDMDGFAVVRQLRKDHPKSTMTVIALSGYAENASESKEAGFDLHLIKPIDLRVLQKLLANPSMP